MRVVAVNGIAGERAADLDPLGHALPLHVVVDVPRCVARVEIAIAVGVFVPEDSTMKSIVLGRWRPR